MVWCAAFRCNRKPQGQVSCPCGFRLLRYYCIYCIALLQLTAFVLALWITILAVYRTIVSGFKRDFALFLTLRANCLVHLPWPAESTTTTLISHVSSFAVANAGPSDRAGCSAVTNPNPSAAESGIPAIPKWRGTIGGISAKDLALSCDYRTFKKDCKYFFILRRPGHWGAVQKGRICHPIRQGALYHPSLFSPVFFVSFPLPSFSWPILSDTFYMNNYLWSQYSPYIAREGNFEEKREFLKKIGSNFRLTGVIILFSYNLPYNFLAQKLKYEKWGASRMSRGKTSRYLQVCIIRPDRVIIK